MKRFKVEISKGPFRIHGHVQEMGQDILVSIRGGTKPHMGALGIAIPSLGSLIFAGWAWSFYLEVPIKSLIIIDASSNPRSSFISRLSFPVSFLVVVCMSVVLGLLFFHFLFIPPHLFIDFGRLLPVLQKKSDDLVPSVSLHRGEGLGRVGSDQISGILISRRYAVRPLANRTLLQMDQTKSSDQNLLWDFPECSEDPNLDCYLCLRARGHHQKETQYQPFSQ